jgi:hypothetical protein
VERGYQSQDLANLITREPTRRGRGWSSRRRASDQGALKMAAHIRSDGARAVDEPRAAGLGQEPRRVNLDFEGKGNGDQAGLDALVAQVSAAVKGTNPHWQVTMDTYASSAGDPGGFYDIAGLAPSVDAFFVMAYDMNATSPSPTAALTGSGFTDLDALQEYTAVVPASKVILGVPYYGYDWPTTGPDLGAAATGAADTAQLCADRQRQPSVVLGSDDADGVDVVPDGDPVAPDLVRQPHVAGAEGAVGQLVPYRRHRSVGPRDGREQPGHVVRPPRERSGGEELRGRSEDDGRPSGWIDHDLDHR